MPGGSVRGNVRERNVTPRDPYNTLSAEEIRLAKTRFADGGMRPCEIAELLRRDTSTMTRLPIMRKARAPPLLCRVCGTSNSVLAGRGLVVVVYILYGEREKQGRPKMVDTAMVDKRSAQLRKRSKQHRMRPAASRRR